ncbi:MAG TPA: RNA methyltransferase [Acidimicrobiia bacterium]|jgi:tRNA G18 (ribose-2'-O)-methylase SpoU
MRLRIEDPADPRIAPYTRLTDERLRRHREGPGGDLSGVFICEGELVTRRAIDAGLQPISILVSDDTLHRVPPDLGDGVDVYVGTSDLVEHVTGFRFHRGFVAAFERPADTPADEVLASARKVLVCENVTNPTNLGVMIRSAAALGIDAVLLDPTTCDPLYRRVVRVSMGTVFSFPFARLPAFPAGLDVVSAHGHLLVGLTPDPAATSIGTFDFPDEVALVVGAEGPGLSERTARRVDQLVRIPMRPGVDSLNVGAAAAVAAYVVGDLDGPSTA